MPALKPIHFAVLGPHNRGRISLLAHRPDEGLRLVAACASHLENLDDYRTTCGEGFFLTTDYREILANPEVDAVFVCTPDHLHAEHAVAALNAGKHVFLEKPMATTIADCDAIIEAAARTGAKLYVGHNMRFFPVVRKMRELIEAGPTMSSLAAEPGSCACGPQRAQKSRNSPATSSVHRLRRGSFIFKSCFLSSA